jgi:hypothetical protein
MGVPRPTRDKAEGDREKVSADVERASRVSESQQADIQDLPRNEARRDVPPGGPWSNPRAGAPAAQDVVQSTDDVDLESTLLRRSSYAPGFEGARGEASPVRGPSTGSQAGRAITERETVADDEADADATDRNAARADDPDAT